MIEMKLHPANYHNQLSYCSAQALLGFYLTRVKEHMIGLKILKHLIGQNLFGLDVRSATKENN